MTKDFYRQLDPVEEKIVPPENAIVISSEAKEATVNEKEAKQGVLSQRVMKYIGENELVDGISVRDPDYLKRFFNERRKQFSAKWDKVTNKIDDIAGRYYAREESFTSTIASLHTDPNERLIPGFLSILVASMTGSVLARRRTWLLRATMPIILGSCCFAYAMPTTFRNTMGLIHNLEMNTFPHFTERQDRVWKETKRLSTASVQYYYDAKKWLNKDVEKTGDAIKNWTGVNVK
ncbi:Mos2p [Saccharomyces cerevisiae YJM1418]|nr:Mos2p [Saccharomyces cerevisiae YJM1418]CAI4493500.1 BAI_1a_G0022000.mRNA.1.CDS.1 [Saccharomyces cerevisiae]CAI4499938.1 CCN_G0022120.mRNA.1.CDS.1 [Saccharomyces cerevisiae]CAI7134432.1 BAI_1a_G0022000.mRNA.1.CDS.1 [Saccharomyces cerevisiae]CAI7314856.1 CCN_G0022120.mRNA.1.CDS.1 [Saccharomyces cerevisiae]